jgi:mono/diheme cytochrome c family protein
MRLFVALSVALSFSPAARADDAVTFKDHGKVVKTLTVPEIEHLDKALAPQEIRVVEPHLGQEVVYVGYPARAVFQAIYGKDWEKAEEFLLTCVDGYQPNIPAKQFLESTAFFAFRKADGGDFTIRNKQQDDKVVPLGPLYLVWENIKDEAMHEDGGSSWPYQVNGVDVISFAEKYPNLAPPVHASARAKDGFLLFRKRCFSCHTVNGQGGGASGIELNYPVSVTEYFRPEWLAKFIDQPKDVRHLSPMPPYSVNAKNRKAQIGDVIAYLEVMAKNKKAPAPPKP